MAKGSDDFQYEITEKICVLGSERNGRRKELNLVSWNGKEPKLDILL